MNVTGIVVEYNPLHNGHIFHLNKTKKITQNDYVIAVMSGNFVQRGEPAFINKWARTKMALEAGIDLVIELPTIYSVSSAEGFAFGAISILNSLEIVDSICFGSELGSIYELNIIGKILAEEPPSYQGLLKYYLKHGLSYPAARLHALTDYISDKNILSLGKNHLNTILQSSNNILAIEYLKALHKLSSTIKPYTIKRVKSKYNDIHLTGYISSATAIRKNFHDLNAVKESMPDFTYKIIQNEISCGRGPVCLNDFSQMILYKLRESSRDFIKSLIDVGEGLENKIKFAAEEASNIEELISMLKNKRYTTTRLQRILIYALLNMTKDIQNQIKMSPDYIRILGFNEKGKDLIKLIKSRCKMPLIINPSKKDTDILVYDMLATDIYVLAYKNNAFRKARQDLKVPPVIKPASI
ncbi:nucleotidyltransferase [Fonticella tunisiensis]|uniref:tRNA(Met) cytidine acetate ligase n=1 Tax=Fonticella tunisiensis TaxID=1096341 RepID=A0A4R7KQX0_9CLOT|nr:nucleotidyltransferase [Fonticella tunisiensis]TDT61620.1 putative nucleotidyltransferase [Fonticella tunisiensis]